MSAWCKPTVVAISLSLWVAGCTSAGNGKGDRANESAAAPGKTISSQGVRPNDLADGGAAVAAADASSTTDPASPDASQPTADGAEMLAPRSSFAGYGAESYRLVSEKDEIVSVLKNGMVVIAKRIPSPVVAVRGVALTGGIYEKQWLGGGLSHLLEHLVAGGSSERRTEAENRDLLQKIGNNSNAYTTEDNTSFFINTTPAHMEQAVDLVSGWMLGAMITVPEYKREYQVVQRELEMGKGEPDRAFYYLSAMNRYRISPARVPVIGYQEVIQRLSRDDVYTYYKMAYQPNNMVFCVAGDLDPRAMLSAVQKNVAGAPPGRVFSHNIEAEPPVLTPRTLVCTFPKLGQARLLIGYPGVSIDNTDMYAMDLLATILGGGESSVMTEALRDKQQLVSSVGAFDDTPAYVDGTFSVEMTLEPEKVEAGAAEAIKIIEAVKANGVDEERLARAKTQMRSARVNKLQKAEDIAASLADDYRTTGDIHFSDKYVDRCNVVTADQIKAAANKYLDRGKLITTAMFPSEWAGSAGLPRAENLLRGVSPASQPGATQPAIASETQRTVLANGTVLLVKRIASSPTVVINMYALGGVTVEDEKTNGLGSLTMQMLTRGTRTRSAEQIAAFFDSTGGDMNAACGNNSWYWTANCLKADFAKTLAIYADVVNNPTFAPAELVGMKRRVEAAIRGEDADWTHQSIRFFKHEFYGPSHSPYQFLPEGTIENVDSFSDQELRQWYADKVLRGKRVLAIYGDVDVAEAQKLATDLLGAAPPAPSPPATAVAQSQPGADEPATVAAAAEAPATQPFVDVQRVAVNKTEQEGIAGVIIGFNADTIIGDKDYFPLVMAKTLTGGYTYPTGYLFETLRGKGLVYVVESQNTQGLNRGLPGNFMVFAGCDPARVNEVVDLCLENVARLQGNATDINATWYTRAKELITVADAMEHETPGDQASTAAINELFGLGYGWQDAFAPSVEAVPMPRVTDAARRRLTHCVVTISTPAPQDVKVKAGRRTYASFPPVDLTPRGVQHDAGGGGAAAK